MNSIDFESLLVIVFVLVDDWYQSLAKSVNSESPGVKPEMSNSEIMTLALMMDYLPFPGETQFLGAAHSRRSSSSTTGERSLSLRANYGKWFPNLLERSQFNRRLRKLEYDIEILRRMWVQQLRSADAKSFVIDTKPIPVVGYKRSKKHSDFYGSANADAMRPSRLAAVCAPGAAILCSPQNEVLWLQTSCPIYP